MPWAQGMGMVLIALLFGAMGFYLSLIAKFYRLKFHKGPPHRTMQASLVVFVVGLCLSSEFFGFLPPVLPAVLICLGGAGFSGFAYALYRTMMTIH